MRRGLSIPLFLAFMALGTSASAAPFGEGGVVSLSADRLMGFYVQHAGNDSNSILGIGQTVWDNPYSTARFGVDVFVVDHLSIGGSLAYSRWDLRRSGNQLLFSPRIGYTLPFSRAFGFWPRGGFTYLNTDGNDRFALTLEGMFYGSPVDHMAFIFGPAFDIELAGNGTKLQNFGILTAGILGWI